MVIVSLDSPSCEVTLFDPLYRWFIGTLPDRPRDYTLWSGLAYLSRYNSGWFCHTTPKSYSTNHSHVVKYVGWTRLSPPVGYHYNPWGWVQIKLSDNSRHHTY
jgi:hypothetical protein